MGLVLLMCLMVMMMMMVMMMIQKLWGPVKLHVPGAVDLPNDDSDGDNNGDDDDGAGIIRASEPTCAW